MSYKIDFTTFDWQTSTLTVTISGATISSQLVRSATVSNGALGKVYGRIDFAKGGVAATVTVNLSDTGLRPNSQMTINSAGILAPYDSSYHLTTLKSVDLVVNTDGTASVTFSSTSSELGGQIIFTPFVIFSQNFGD